MNKLIKKYYVKRDAHLDRLAISNDSKERDILIKQCALINEVLTDLENLKRGYNV